MAAAASRAWAASSGTRRGVTPEGRAPDVDGGDHVAARVVDRRGHRIEIQLVLADRHRVAATADPGELLEQRLELDDRPLRVADEAAPDDPQDLALGQRRQQDLARRDAVERRGSPGPVTDGDEVRAVDLGDRQHRVALEDPETGRLVGQPRQALEFGQRDPAQVEGPLRALGEADDDQPEAVLAGLVVLFDEAALLERGEQPRGGRLVQPEPARELGHPGLALALAEGEQECRGPIDRSDGVAVEDHPARPVQPAAGCDIAPLGSGADARRARGPRAPRRASRRRS